MSKNKAEEFLSSLSVEEKEQFMKDMRKELNNTHTSSDAIAPSVNEDFVVRNRKTNTIKRREEVKAGKNQWSDTGEFKEVDTPLPDDFAKTPRRKAPPKKSEVECHMCGKKFKQDSRYSYGDFPRCNRCTGR